MTVLAGLTVDTLLSGLFQVRELIDYFIHRLSQ